MDVPAFLAIFAYSWLTADLLLPRNPKSQYNIQINSNIAFLQNFFCDLDFWTRNLQNLICLWPDYWKCLCKVWSKSFFGSGSHKFLVITLPTLTFEPIAFSISSAHLYLLVIIYDHFHQNISIRSGDIKANRRRDARTDRRTNNRTHVHTHGQPDNLIPPASVSGGSTKTRHAVESLTCAEKLARRQLSLPHRYNWKLMKKSLKRKPMKSSKSSKSMKKIRIDGHQIVYGDR